MVLFREVQRFTQAWLWIVILLSLSGAFVAIYEAQNSRAIRNAPGAGPAITILSVISAAVVGWISQAKLITEVRSDALSVRFFLLWPERLIPWNEIQSAEPVTYNPLLEYGGWGVRFGRNGRAYNVKGSRGVQLVLTNGKRILVGSEQPEALARSIWERTGRRPPA